MKHQATTQKTTHTATSFPATTNPREERMINLLSKLEFLGIDPVALKEFINADKIPERLLTTKAKRERAEHSLNRIFNLAEFTLKSNN